MINAICSFIEYDIRELYPSNLEKAIDEVLKLDKKYILISKGKINIIKHCCKSLLNYNEEL